MAMDYENKKVGIIDSITPTVDIEKDMLFIQEKYKDIKGVFLKITIQLLAN